MDVRQPMRRRVIRGAMGHLVRIDAEEWLNVLTHGFGLAVATVAGAAALVYAYLNVDAWRVVGTGVYVATLLYVLAASTLYHGASPGPAKLALRRADHLGIKLLIAGSYTPFLLAHARFGAGWALLVAVWGMVGLGVALQFALSRERYFRWSLPLYLAMGLLAVPFLPLLASVSPPGTVTYLAVGGAVYIAGVVFYVWERLPFSHAIWHVFVVSASAIHFCAVAFFVL